MVKRVGILTLPIHTNYGGNIQAAALYQFLVKNNKEPVLLRKKPARSMPQRLLASILPRIPGQNFGSVRSNEQARALHYPFLKKFMPQATGKLRKSADFQRAVRRHKLDAVIVGSDQVWRFEFHNDHEPMIYFLDFIPSGNVRGISYAASFGRSHWAYPESTADVKRLLSKFYAVSVREDSGADICRDNLGREDCAVTLDPTLLVEPSFYDEAVAKEPVYTGPRIVTYILDQSATVQKTSAAVIAALGGDIETFSLAISQPNGGQLDIPQWLRAIRDAEFVMTDSFHGTVFSILFQKRFVTVPNVDRGLDRFTSLLSKLGLSDRLLTNDDPVQISRLVHEPIDYDEVELKLKPLREASSKFLISSLD